MIKISCIPELISLISSDYHNPQALNEKKEDRWISISHLELVDQVKKLSLFLDSIGVKKGDAVGILSPPCIKWTIADLSIMSIGAISVPLFANISEENFVFESTQPSIKTLFLGGADQWKMYEKHTSLFEKVISIDSVNKEITFQEALDKGGEILNQNPDRFNELSKRVLPDDDATIIYTSGSTGVPKGAVLTHDNLIGGTHDDRLQWNPLEDKYLSILPLAHVFGRSLNCIMLHWGIPVYYFNDLKNFGEACREIHPSVTAVVPRLLEKIYAKIISKVESLGFLQRSLWHWAFNLASHEDDFLVKTVFHPLADKTIFSALRDTVGGNFRAVISGGAALNPQLTQFFWEIGIPVLEGYGLTEASIISVNSPTNNKIGTVGPYIDVLTVKISDEGELLVKGIVCMKEYYKNPEATAQIFDSEGFLKTGDKATLDDEGFITIIGRVKDLVKSSVGEYIAPVPIEREFCKAPFIELAMVVADKRKFVSVLLFPNFEVLKSLKTAQELDSLTDEEFLNSEYIKIEMERLIKSINSRLNHWEQVHAYRFVLIPPTVESGELTPSMKIRRDVVTNKYKDLIDSMYPQEAQL